MKLNIKNMRKLIMLSIVFAGLVSACTKNKTPSSSVVSFLGQDAIEVNTFTDFGYLKVVDAAGNYQYFNNNLPDTLGFAVDTINKFVTLDGQVVDTLWLTRPYLGTVDTTSEGYRTIFVPVEQYNRGKISAPFAFNYQVAKVRSDEGSLDIAGSYKKGSATIVITKVGTGTYVMNNANAASISQPNVVYVKPDNTLEMPFNKTGFGLGTGGGAAIVNTAYYNISYTLAGASPGVGDTLRYTYKREARGAVINTLIRQ